MRGVFITFEGSEGCGKSTQSLMLAEFLKSQGREVVYVREPGGTLISEKIRAILLDAKHDGMSGECEMLLYMAARAQIIAEVIEPALKKGAVVICDRFLDSTLAYQGYGLGMELDFIGRVGGFATRAIHPDLTILMDLPVEAGLKHREAAKDRIEQRPLAYHNKVREGYLALAKNEPGRIKIVKVEKEKEKTQKKIQQLVEKVIIA